MLLDSLTTYYTIAFYFNGKAVYTERFKNYLNAVMAFKALENKNYKLDAYDDAKLIQINATHNS